MAFIGKVVLMICLCTQAFLLFQEQALKTQFDKNCASLAKLLKDLVSRVFNLNYA
jgi:hypothetical protein